MALLLQMEFFYHVVLQKSFSRAAVELGVSKGYLSMQITELEKTLNTRLLYRTTRQLSLTEEGALFFESCKKIELEKQAALALLQDTQAEPSGQLRVTAPPSMCATFLPALLTDFLRRYPKVSLAVEASSTVVNLLQQGMDVALRVTSLPDENSVARLLATFHAVVCATPTYLHQYGMPRVPMDLMQHPCLIYSADPARNAWEFQDGKTIQVVKVNSHLQATSVSLVKHALLADSGIARLPSYVVAEELAKKQLVELFAENRSATLPVYAIYQGGTSVPLRVKCFVAFMRERLQQGVL